MDSNLVNQIYYVFVQIVKARHLPDNCRPYVKIKLGNNCTGMTAPMERTANPEWNKIFAFSRDAILCSVIEILVKSRSGINIDDEEDKELGHVSFYVNEIPGRVPLDRPLAAQWYRLEQSRDAEIMLAIWMGTQADEAFAEAWHSGSATDVVNNVRPKVYMSPKLWYLRVHVIEAKDLHLVNKVRERFPRLFVKACLGNQRLHTDACLDAASGLGFLHVWNEELLFVVAEPFQEPLFLSVMDHNDEVLGKCEIILQNLQIRLEDEKLPSKWFFLEKPEKSELQKEVQKEGEEDSIVLSKIHVRLFLEGGYHVLEQSLQYSSDLRPAAKQLWKPAIGMLEVGVVKASDLEPVRKPDEKTSIGTADAYCVARYGQKWVKTRTIIDSLNPNWNEYYTWEVYDPCTVLTVGVFHNNHIEPESAQYFGKDKLPFDLTLGKVRIRISTLEVGEIQILSYPLRVVQPSSGLTKMGELHLAVRFCCFNKKEIIQTYINPLLPELHYTNPLKMHQIYSLKKHAISIVADRLARAEPPLRKEVVEYILQLDSSSCSWSMRRAKATLVRIMNILSGLVGSVKFFAGICRWETPVITVFMHIWYVVILCYPWLILPCVFGFMFMCGLWNCRDRRQQNQNLTQQFWYVDTDEADEEIDTVPTSKDPETVKMRYDRLRGIAGRLQALAGDIASVGERIQSVLSWRDPTATNICMALCIISALVVLLLPMQLVAGVAGFYVMRHPKFRRSKLPSMAFNFFRRLPAKTDHLS